MDSIIQVDFNEIVSNFRFEGEFLYAKPYGCGHINDTYAAYFKKSNGEIKRYILQKVNTHVFSNPEKLMNNIQSITDFLRKKITAEGGDPDKETLNLIYCKDGKHFYKSARGEYWRSYIFIENARTYQIVENMNHFYNAGKAFGKFQSLLSDFPAETLYEIIPDFHNTKKRLEYFIECVEKDPFNRAGDVKDEIKFVMDRANEASLLLDLSVNGNLPLRVTHNDTKFNNVMIDDKTGKGICVIDLDTVMPGLSLYDFGDSIRSGANPAEEDEKDLSKVWMDLGLYEQYTKGYLESARDFLTPVELEYLPLSAKIMTFECGIRFLGDYINGDVYFKVHRKGHNLDRARTQFKMVADMESKFEEMKNIVNRYSK